MRIASEPGTAVYSQSYVEQDKKSFFQSLGCDAEIVTICVRDSTKSRDFKMGPGTKVSSEARHVDIIFCSTSQIKIPLLFRQTMYDSIVADVRLVTVCHGNCIQEECFLLNR